MPFVFIVIGIGLVVVAIRGTQADAFALLRSEFSGPNSFIKWALAIFILGAVGYIPKIQPVTRALLILVILAIFLKNGNGLFASFNNQVAAAGTTSGGSVTGTTSGGSVTGTTNTSATAQPYLDTTSGFNSASGTPSINQQNQSNANATGNFFNGVLQKFLGYH